MGAVGVHSVADRLLPTSPMLSWIGSILERGFSPKAGVCSSRGLCNFGEAPMWQIESMDESIGAYADKGPGGYAILGSPLVRGIKSMALTRGAYAWRSLSSSG